MGLFSDRWFFGNIQKARRSKNNPFIFMPFSVAPYYHALNSCFLAQIWVTGRMPATSGERNPKYPGSGFGRNQESAVRIEPIYFRFLRASVTPWCKGFVFGCGYIAPCLRGVLLLFISPGSPDKPDATDGRSHARAVL